MFPLIRYVVLLRTLTGSGAWTNRNSKKLQITNAGEITFAVSVYLETKSVVQKIKNVQDIPANFLGVIGSEPWKLRPFGCVQSSCRSSHLKTSHNHSNQWVSTPRWILGKFYELLWPFWGEEKHTWQLSGVQRKYQERTTYDPLRPLTIWLQCDVKWSLIIPV